MLRESDAFLTSTEADYLKALDLSVTLVDALYDNRANLRSALLETGRVSKSLHSTLEDGYGRVEGYLHGAGPADYTRADCPQYGALKGDNCD